MSTLGNFRSRFCFRSLNLKLRRPELIWKPALIFVTCASGVCVDSSGIDNNPTVFYRLMPGSTAQTNKFHTFYLQQRAEKSVTWADIKVNHQLDYESIKEYNLTIRVEVCTRNGAVISQTLRNAAFRLQSVRVWEKRLGTNLVATVGFAMRSSERVLARISANLRLPSCWCFWLVVSADVRKSELRFDFPANVA